LGVDGNNKDSQYAYGIKAMLENNIISPSIIDNIGNRVCMEEGLCIKETVFVIYAHTNKFENFTTQEIEMINSNGILIKVKKISKEKVEIK